MAIATRLPPPRGGGSARGAIRYILAEELTAKVSHPHRDDPIHPEQYQELSALMREANARADLGVGHAWSPATGGGVRPSSVYARGVTSLYTADLEIQVTASAQTRVRSPVAHFVVSLNAAESRRISDEQLIRFTEATLDGAGYLGHAAVFAVHRDTDNLHCHVAVSAVHSRTLRAADRKHDNIRLAASTREQELAFGMDTDYGLAVIRDRGLPTERVERTNAEDWKRRKRELAEERVAGMARRFIADESGLESVRDREDRIIHGLRDYLERCADRSEVPLASDVHVLVARLTGRIEGVRDGKLAVRLMERGEARAAWVPSTHVLAIDPRRIAYSTLDAADSGNNITKYSPTPWRRAEHARAVGRRAFLLGIGTVEDAEAAYRQTIAADPGRVSRDLVYGAGRANFTAEDIEALLATHLTDGWAEETDRVLREDTTLKILSVDTASPLYTIETQQDISEKFDRLLRQLLAEKDPHFDRAALDGAIARVEARHREKNPAFAFTAQQHKAFDSFERRIAVWMGEAGTGKSILNEVHREYAEATEREIRGFATAQKAADVLRDSSGIASVNQARALTEEARDGVLVMPNGARFVFDEFSMASVQAGVAILERAIAAGASGIVQGDLSQLPNISAGDTFAIATRAAVDAKTLVRLNEVYRQQVGSEVEWMRLAVPKGGRAIRTANAIAFRSYLEDFMDRGHVLFHTDHYAEIQAIAADILAEMRAGQRVIAPGRSFADCLYVNRAVRAGLGLEGAGQEFTFDRGVIELAVGDRVLFRKNDRRLDVRNGDTGTVTGMATDGRRIDVALDNGRTATFDPKRYRKLEYAYSSTIHANQGTGAPAVIGSITKSDDARSVHVTATRTERVLRMHTHLKRDEILERLSSERSLAPKDDALLFQAIVHRTGGPDTPWALAVKAAQAHDADPLRMRHEAVMEQRRSAMTQQIREIMRHSDVKPRERDARLREVVDRFPLQSFVQWAAAERSVLEHEFEVRQRTERYRAERSQTYRREIERSRSPEQLRGVRR